MTRHATAHLFRRARRGAFVAAAVVAVAAGVVCFATSDTGLFYALDARTGAERFKLAFNRWPMFSSPAIVKGMAYIGSRSGKLQAIDVKKGAVAWTFETKQVGLG